MVLPELLKPWPFLHTISDDMMKQLKIIFVYGEANSAIMVTEDDDVYSIGCNKNGRLGTGDADDKPNPTLINVLCKKKIIHFAFGTSNYMVALTEDGKVYSWGVNDSGQLGNGTYQNCTLPTQVNLYEEVIVQIACASSVTVALTKQGEVYAWGKLTPTNQSGYNSHHTQSSYTHFNIPMLMDFAVKAVMQIACSQDTKFILSNSGSVYRWELPIIAKRTENYHKPKPTCVTKIKIADDKTVQKIVCGKSQLLMLTDAGYLYVRDNNDVGQVGTTQTNAILEQELIREANQITIGKIMDIDAVNSCSISVVLACDGRVFVWGFCRNSEIHLPMPTSFKNIHEAFGYYGSPNVLPSPMNIQSKAMNKTLTNDLEEAFDNPANSDLVIKVQGKLIHVHRSILKIRSEYFDRMFQEHWKENVQSIMVNDVFSYEVFKSFLKYLYTDRIELTSKNTFDEFLNLANAYLEPELKEKYAEVIQPHIKADNVLSLYKAAIDYDAPGLRRLCLNFAVKNITETLEVLESSTIDEKTLKTFLIEVAKSRRAFRT